MIWVGFSWVALAVTIALYVLRMFAITGFYHRYFSHRNHHHYPASVRQGFYWWEFDITFYALKVMSFAGLIWDLRPVPATIREGVGKRS